MTLYSCLVDGDQYRITKFDDYMNPQSSYLCTETECECPAGVRPICRHREMLPKFIERKTVGTDWWFDYDRGGWVQMGNGDGSVDLPEDDFDLLTGGGSGPDLPEGVVIMGLDDPLALHNAISKAVGEPYFKADSLGSPKPLPPAHYPSWRRI
jgi:hypothetical protein